MTFGGDGSHISLVPVDPQKRKSRSRWSSCSVFSGGGCVSSLEGGLLSTLDDYAKFLLAVVSGGAHPVTGVRILSPASAVHMLEDQTALLQSTSQCKIPKNA